MDITFQNPGIEYMIDCIMGFQGEDETDFWTEPLYRFYPQIDRAHAKGLAFAERKAYIEGVLRTIYDEIGSTIDEKVGQYAAHWEKHRQQVTQALSDAFELDCGACFNDLTCNVSMNPIMPRFLRERSFDVFYLSSERGALGLALHEKIHFVWFYVWNQEFSDSYDEYERPSLKWILSEMVVESIMSDARLSSINPYYPREEGGCVYPYFFDMRVQGEPVLDTLDRMYRELPIREFMRRAYAYCQQYEAEIRSHIERAENA